MNKVQTYFHDRGDRPEIRQGTGVLLGRVAGDADVDGTRLQAQSEMVRETGKFNEHVMSRPLTIDSGELV
jgi:hypothetical protein